MHINYNSVRTIIKRYKDRGSGEIKARSGPLKKKWHYARERLIIREIKKNRRLKKQDLLNKVNENEDIKLHVANAQRSLVALHIHGHKATITAYDGVEQPVGAY